jgi:AAA+ ATPase superfamily predicted ATPase
METWLVFAVEEEKILPGYPNILINLKHELYPFEILTLQKWISFYIRENRQNKYLTSIFQHLNLETHDFSKI